MKHRDHLYVHPGIAHQKKKGVVEKKSQISLELPDDSPDRLVEIEIGSDGVQGDQREERGCRLSLVDFDGDGRAEILTISRDRGRGRVRIIELTTSGS